MLRQVKDQQYGQPIVDIKFHQTAEGSYLLAADKTILKIWDHTKASEGLFASIEPPADINEINIFPHSGLMVMATEQPRLHIYFVPALGPSPKWASFLVCSPPKPETAVGCVMCVSMPGLVCDMRT